MTISKSAIVLLFLSCSIFVAPKIAEAKEVTLMIYLDFSGSMDDNREKVSRLVPIITSRMKRACGKFRIATNNIIYADVEHNNYRPYGSPAYITDEMPNAVDELTQRINSPFRSSGIGTRNQDSTYHLVSGDQEVTYSTFSRSIIANREQLVGQDLVAALLLTDAAPGFEMGSPESELALVKQALGATDFVAGAISVNLKNGTKMSEIDSTCRPDMSGVLPNRFQGNVLPPDVQEWMNNDLENLQTYTRLSGGWNWNLCTNDFEASIEDFLQLVIMQSGCQVMM